MSGRTQAMRASSGNACKTGFLSAHAVRDRIAALSNTRVCGEDGNFVSNWVFLLCSGRRAIWRCNLLGYNHERRVLGWADFSFALVSMRKTGVFHAALLPRSVLRFGAKKEAGGAGLVRWEEKCAKRFVNRRPRGDASDPKVMTVLIRLLLGAFAPSMWHLGEPAADVMKKTYAAPMVGGILLVVLETAGCTRLITRWFGKSGTSKKGAVPVEKGMIHRFISR